jgi:hypothetical protein
VHRIACAHHHRGGGEQGHGEEVEGDGGDHR